MQKKVERVHAKKDKIVPKKRRYCVEIRDSCSRRMWGRVLKNG